MNFGWNSIDVTKHLVPMRRYAASLTRHTQDAEDLVHTALLRAYERRGTFRTGADLRTWLMAVLHSTFVDGWRQRVAERSRVVAAALHAPNQAEPRQLHAVHLSQVFQSYSDLPEDFRAAFHLVALEGFTYQQASDILGIPIGTVMSRISRTRDILREQEDSLRSTRPSNLRVVGGSSHER
jgi:RNA polymerase sigma-70 factor (ECF subfamily)